MGKNWSYQPTFPGLALVPFISGPTVAPSKVELPAQLQTAQSLESS